MASACRAKDRDRLTEPYVTTREKGTGLGSRSSSGSWKTTAASLILTDAATGPGRA